MTSFDKTTKNRFKPDQTGSNRFKPEKKQKKNRLLAKRVQTRQQKKCTISSCNRLYKPSRHCNYHHNRCSISAQQFTLSLDQHTYSVASPAAMSSSDHAKSAKHVCEKCGLSFGRRDNLLRHIRTVCTSCRTNTITVYTCKKCGRNFD